MRAWLEGVRAWLRARWVWLWCADRGHVLRVHRSVRYMGREGQMQLDEWMTCRCGQRSSEVTRTRIRRPYEPTP